MIIFVVQQKYNIVNQLTLIKIKKKNSSEAGSERLDQGSDRGRGEECRSTAAAKSLQLCPTLCDAIDGSPPGSAVPGILQARTLEWAAISFSNA